MKEKTRRGRGEGRNFSFRHFSHVNFHDVKHSPTHSSMTRNPRRVSMYLEEVSVAARPALSATRKAFRYLARQQFCALICGVETAPTGVLHNNFLPWHDVCTEPTRYPQYFFKNSYTLEYLLSSFFAFHWHFYCP